VVLASSVCAIFSGWTIVFRAYRGSAARRAVQCCDESDMSGENMVGVADGPRPNFPSD